MNEGPAPWGRPFVRARSLTCTPIQPG